MAQNGSKEYRIKFDNLGYYLLQVKSKFLFFPIWETIDMSCDLRTMELEYKKLTENENKKVP